MLTAWYTELGPLHQSQQSRIIAFWFATLMFTSCLWAARISILASIVKVIPFTFKLRRTTAGLAGLFIAMWTVLVVQKVVICTRSTEWHQSQYLQCPLPRAVGITELCTDFVSDSILVAIPLRLLWNVRLPRNQRILILLLFSMSFFTMVASVAHAAFVLSYGGILQGMTAHIEASVSLIVCNLLVLVTYIYRAVRHGDDLESTPSHRQPLSSIVVNNFTTYGSSPTAGRIHTIDLELTRTSLSDPSSGRVTATSKTSDQSKKSDLSGEQDAPLDQTTTKSKV
ncbi:hypothetical protein PLICRDRAFT_33984 [Plicaturopsis crispa FD-325 SS-3]|nr:hypothetical protein PLICRDRAFT_33984 [Plicaturopsis crispa FD-325 SS-3]